MKKYRDVHSFSQRIRKEIFKSKKSGSHLKENYHIRKLSNSQFSGIVETYHINEECEVTFLKMTGSLIEKLKKRMYTKEIFRVIYCLEGECTVKVTFEGKENFYNVNKGDILFQKGHDERVTDFEISATNLKILYFDIYINRFLINLMKSLSKDKVEIFKRNIDNIFIRDNIVFWEMDSKAKGMLSKILYTDYLYKLDKFLDFRSDVSVFYNYMLKLENITPKSDSKEESHIFSEVKNIINEYKVTEIPSLKTISELLDISGYKINTAFDKYEKMSFFQYVQKLKMEYSKEIILNSDKSISEISLEIGYQNPGKFSHIFKKHFGISPSMYRRINMNPL